MQSIDGENFTEILSVDVAGAPVVDDVENLGADDSAQDYRDTQVPSVLSFDALLLGVADADPETDQYAGRNQDSVGGDAKTADMEELWKHDS